MLLFHCKVFFLKKISLNDEHLSGYHHFDNVLFYIFALNDSQLLTMNIFQVIITCQEEDDEDVLTNEDYDKLKRVIYLFYLFNWDIFVI